MKSPIALLLCLVDDFTRLNPDVKGLDRDLQTIEKRFKNEGYGFLTVALLSLDEALLVGLSSGKFTCPSNFKPVRGGAIPRFLSGMLCEVFEPLSGILKDDIDFGVLKSLRELLRLFKKIQLQQNEVDKLHSEAVTEFFRCDELAKQVILPDRLDHHIGRVSKLILSTLSSKSIHEGVFRHGPGAVYEGLSANQKWKALLNSVKNAEFDLDTFGYGDFEVGLSDLSERPLVPVSMDPVSFVCGASSSKARLISVPKSSTSRRTITVEPVLNQFRQQGLMTLLRESISECGVLSKSIDLTDQTHNQKLALEGSLFDNWATIDLKSASDLLSVKLVESVFRHQGSFFDLMMDCRSSSVESDLTATEHLGKFAGMGNALTFPVQSICFTVTCIAAILDVRGQTPTYWNVRRAARHIRVFGDDIIISTQYAHQCVDWLHAVGLKVNVKKSFLTGNFKESCGVDAFRGVDITPLYLSHRPDATVATPELIANYVSLSNQSWMRGLYKFSNYLREVVEDLLRKRLPLVSRKSGALGWHSRQDAMNPHKWNHSTQQFCTRTLVIVPLKRKDRLDGLPALLKFFHKPRPKAKVHGEGYTSRDLHLSHIFPLTEDVDHLSSTQIRYKNRICARWVPTRAFGTD